MKFLSCFSGIEAASVAFEPLGWECVGVSEFDAAASRVLAHRFPNVPNLGDVMAEDFIERAKALRPDMLVGGPPCQDFSIAGLRAGIHGARGNLTLRWVQIIHAVRPRLVLTENVPGWLSANDGHAFGAFLSALVGCDTVLLPSKECGGRWTDAGMVDGPEGRAAWRILDAQYFGLAQRRRRVFVVFCPRNGADPAAVLFERQGLRGNSAPRREKREGAAGIAQAGAGIGFGGGNRAGPIEQAAWLTAKGQRLDYEVETFVAQPVANTLLAKGNDSHAADLDTYVAHALRGEGFDASEDGTGRGTPIVSVTIAVNDVVGSMCAESGPNTHGSRGVSGSQTMLSGYIQPVRSYRTSGNCGAWDTGDKVDALTTGTDPNSHVLAFSCKDHGADATSDLAPTLRSMGHAESHANAGGQLAVAWAIQAGALRENPDSGPDGVGVQQDHAYTLEARAEVKAVAFAQNTRDEVRFLNGDGSIAGALAAEPGMKQQTYVAFQTHGSNIEHSGDVSGTLQTNSDRASGSAPMVAQAFDMRGREGGAQFEGTHDTANIRAASGGSSRSYLLHSDDTLLYKGIRQNGDENGRASETDTAEILRAMRQEIGEEAFTEWGLGISDSFQSQEILRPEMHGGSVRCEAGEGRSGMDDGAPPRAEVGSYWSLREMRKAGCERRSPYGWEPSEQRSEQFAEAMSQLSQHGASTKGFMLSLWEACEGLGILRQALSAVQETRRPNDDQSEPAQPRWAVRRLTPVECEKLQGFPPNWTLVPDARGKPQADGPRYKQLGNSMAVNCMSWIGVRLTEAMP